MTAQYKVKKIETCLACNGDGHIWNEDWRRINRQNEEWRKQNNASTEETVDDWNRRIKARWPYGKPPLEEDWCCKCEGEGKIETWIDLADALRELGVLTGLTVAEAQ